MELKIFMYESSFYKTSDIASTHVHNYIVHKSVQRDYYNIIMESGWLVQYHMTTSTHHNHPGLWKSKSFVIMIIMISLGQGQSIAIVCDRV